MKRNEIPETVERCYLAPPEPLKLLHMNPYIQSTETHLQIPLLEKTRIGEPKEEERERCAFDRGRSCSALVQKRCLFCRFFQTENQLAISRRKAKARVKALGLEKKYE